MYGTYYYFLFNSFSFFCSVFQSINEDTGEKGFEIKSIVSEKEMISKGELVEQRIPFNRSPTDKNLDGKSIISLFSLLFPLVTGMSCAMAYNYNLQRFDIDCLKLIVNCKPSIH